MMLIDDEGLMLGGLYEEGDRERGSIVLSIVLSGRLCFFFEGMRRGVF